MRCNALQRRQHGQGRAVWGIEVVLAALRAHKGAAGVQEAGCGALAKLS
jgi:hypothetical protein